MIKSGINSIEKVNGSYTRMDDEDNKNDKDIGLSSLMEKIKEKATQYKSWSDLVKLARQTIHDKRLLGIGDVNERTQVQKCLDTIQKNIKITSHQSMVERLETITRQLGLKFSAPDNNVFISSDMFYVEVALDPGSGYVMEVKIAHQGDPVSCPELTNVLRESDFLEFTRHLEGLSAIYQLNAKQKAFLALNALETDLSELATFQSTINDPNNLVHRSPVGILEPRKGGHPMKLTYFVSPYDLIDVNFKGSLPLTVDVVIEKKLGNYVTVCIEGSTPHKLQTTSLISRRTQEGKNLPQFAALSYLNSSTLQACFVLKLPKPLPMSLEIVQKITSVTGIELASSENIKAECLVNLIAKQILNDRYEKVKSQNGPFHVKLPDQIHCYHMNQSIGQLKGINITSIPFTHPTSVPQILVHLRQQVLFNVVIGSCIRQVSKLGKANESVTMFELTVNSTSNVNVSFEHPVEESLATMDIDLDINNVKCKLYTATSFSSICTDDYASKIMQRCLSIPVTMRSIIKKCEEKAAALKEELEKQQQAQLQQLNQNDYFNSLASNGTGNQTDSISSYLSQQFLSANQFHQNNLKNLNQLNENADSQNQQYPINVNPASNMQNIMNLQQQQLRQQQMAIQLQKQQQQFQRQQLQQQHQQPQNAAQQKQNNAMLMSMLSDVPAANSQMASFNLFNQQQQYQQQQQQQLQANQAKPKKQRKRKGGNDQGNIRSPGSSAGRSPKRKLSEDDYSRDLPTPGSDYLEAGEAQTSQSRPSSTASAGTPIYDPALSHSRSLENMLTGVKQEPNVAGGINLNDIPNDLLTNFQMLSRQMPFSNSTTGQGTIDLSDLPDLSSFDLTEFGNLANPSALPIKSLQQTAANRRANKRMKSSDSCNDGVASGGAGSDDGANEQQMILKSLEDLHHVKSEDFGSIKSPFSVPAAKIPKTKGGSSGNSSGGGDGRRCSSAGVDGFVGKRGFGGHGGQNDNGPGIAFKKEKKRKRAESVDSIKAVASSVASSMALMPPPMITSTGEVTGAGISFLECPNGGAPALRPLTLNVKPLLPNTSSNTPNINSKSGLSRKSSVSSSGVNSNIVSKSGINKVSGNKVRGSGPKGCLVDMDGSTLPTSSGSKIGLSAKVGSSSHKSGRLPKLSGSPKASKELGFKHTQGLKFKNQNVSSSSSISAGRQSGNATSPPVSSSSMSLSNSSISGSGGSFSKQSQNQQGKGSVPRKRQGSLSAVIDKLRGQTMPGTEQPGTSSSNDSTGKPESTSSQGGNRPDSSSLMITSSKSGLNAGVSSSSGKMNESKLKYSRTSDQFTVKQGSGGTLKLTVTKTKPSSSINEMIGKQNNANRLKALASGSSGTRNSVTSSQGPIKSPGSKGSASNLKRQMNLPTFKTGFKGGGVSSSSGTGSKGVGGRNAGQGKVSSSSSGGGMGSAKSKISSTSGSAILDAAIPRIRIDQLPKIPRTSTSLAASSSSQPNSSSQTCNTPTPHSSQLSASSPMAPSQSSQPLQFRRTYQPREAPPTSTSSIPIERQESIERFQSTSVSSSLSTAALQPETIPPPTSSIQDEVSSETGVFVKAPGVSSTSDAKATSTPSSPIESPTISDIHQNPPPLIPTESIEEPERDNVERRNSQHEPLPSIDSSSNYASEFGCDVGTSFKANFEAPNIVSTSSNIENLVGDLRGPDSDILPSSIKDDQDEDDEEGLVIDFQITPSKNPSARSSANATPTTMDSVSSSNIPSTSLSNVQPNNSDIQNGALQNGPPITSTSASGNNASTGNSTPSSSNVTGGSPSTQSGASSAQRPSPYAIDDDLMDEALVGSGE